MNIIASIVAAGAGAAILFSAAPAAAGTSSHKWKFPPTLLAPWAQEEDEESIDSSVDAAGLCQDRGAARHPWLRAGRVAAGFFYATERGVKVFPRDLKLDGGNEERWDFAQLFDAGIEHLGSFLFAAMRGERAGYFLHEIRVRRCGALKGLPVIREARWIVS